MIHKDGYFVENVHLKAQLVCLGAQIIIFTVMTAIPSSAKAILNPLSILEQKKRGFNAPFLA